MAGLATTHIDSVWKGFAFESLILRELLIYFEITRAKHRICYYQVPGAGEVDFVIETRPKTINRPAEFTTIEVKLSQKWKPEFEIASKQLKKVAGTNHTKMLGVYTGKTFKTESGFLVFNFDDFLKELHSGNLF